jgi:hypothetical protein
VNNNVWETLGIVFIVALWMAPRIIRAWKGTDE